MTKKLKTVCAVLALFNVVGALTAAPNLNVDGVPLLSGPAAGLECAGSETAGFEPGVKLFLNRAYALKEAPEALRGCKFIRGNLESVRAVCKQAGVVFVVTATAGRNPDSRAAVLLERGFQKVNLPEFALFPGDQNLSSVYQKQVAVGDTLDFGKWGVLVVPSKEAKLRLPNSTVPEGVSLKEFVHPPVNFKPGSEYGPAARNYQGIPGIERAPGGRLWAVWYAGKVWEDKYNYVVTATSGDDGQTWSDLKFVIDPDDDGPMRASDPCFWLDPDGRLWLFWWLNGPGELKTVTMAMTTDNPDAETPQWSAPRVICTGVMLNKPIVTRAGEWIFPTAIWKTDGSCRAMVSTDQGRSWTLRGTANVPPAQRNCDEPMIVERRDGSLWQLVRTVFGIGQSVSKDGGRTWTEFTDYLPNATSRFFLQRLASGNFLLVKHGSLDKKIGRSHLTAYLSDDDGATWQGGLILDERDSVSYPDGTQAPDGTIHVIYDWNRGRDKHILMTVFTEADVLAGKFASAAARSRVLINQATGINPRIFPHGKPTPDTNGVALLTGPAAGLESTGSETGVFEPGAKIFLNRTYAVKETPEVMRGCKFIRGNLESVRAVCRQAGVVFVVTATAGRNPDSRAAVLLERGFQKVNLPEFLFFGADRVSVYQKQVAVGDTLDFGKWVVLVLPDKAR